MKKLKIHLDEIQVESFVTQSHKVRGGHESGCPGCPGELTFTEIAPWCSGDMTCPA